MQNKAYDGKPGLKIVGTPQLTGVLSGDDVSAVYVGVKQLATEYGKESTRANVGDKGKWIARNKFKLTGKDSGNYVLGHALKVMGKITEAKVSSVTLKATTAKFTGKAIKPAIKLVKTANGLTVTAADYKVTYYNSKGKIVKSITARGTYKVRVTSTNKNIKGYSEATFKVQ